MGWRAGRVMMGGRDVTAVSGPSTRLAAKGAGGEPSVAVVLALCGLLGDGVGAMPKVKAPEPPKLIRRERLFDRLWAVEPLLDVVDCDQRLRFPMPSRTPLKLLDRRCEAL